MIEIEDIFLRQIMDNLRTRGGITVNLLKKEVIDRKDVWFFPKFPDDTKIVDINSDLTREIDDFINKNLNKMWGDKVYLGVWLNTKINKWYLDIVIGIRNKEVAINKVKEINQISRRKIESIYNPNLNKTIYIDSQLRVQGEFKQDWTILSAT